MNTQHQSENELAKRKKDRQVSYCMTCGEELFGRTDKKFCNDYCRSAHNNKERTGRTKMRQEVNQALKKNYTILRQFLGENPQVVINEEQMKTAGFNNHYLTHWTTSSNGLVIFHCYEFRYHRTSLGYLISTDVTAIRESQEMTTFSVHHGKESAS